MYDFYSTLQITCSKILSIFNGKKSHSFLTFLHALCLCIVWPRKADWVKFHTSVIFKKHVVYEIFDTHRAGLGA